MTRKEEIKRAAINRADKHEFNEFKRCFGLLRLNLYSYSAIWKTEIDSFKAGVAWADENSKSPWISVKDDLPCNHKEMIINANSLNPITKKVLVYNKNKEIHVSWMLYRKDRGWVWDITAYSSPLFFMFIPELPKE